MRTTQIAGCGTSVPAGAVSRRRTGVARPAALSGLDHDAARRYVLSRRTPAGGYSYYRTPEWGVEEPNAPDTLAAIESLRLLGTEPPDAGCTRAWLRSLQDGGGGFPTLLIGWAVLRSLALLGGDPTRPPLAWLSARRRSVFVVRGGRNRREVLADALRVAQLQHLFGVAPVGAEPVRALVTENAADDTLLVGDLETLAIVVELIGTADRALAEEATSFVRACEHPVLGLRIRPDAGATSVGALRSGLWTASQLGIELRHPRSIAANLRLMQRADGGLGLRHRAISSLYATWRGLDADRLLDDYREEQP